MDYGVHAVVIDKGLGHETWTIGLNGKQRRK
jgi:hypothetical protein